MDAVIFCPLVDHASPRRGEALRRQRQREDGPVASLTGPLILYSK